MRIRRRQNHIVGVVQVNVNWTGFVLAANPSSSCSISYSHVLTIRIFLEEVYAFPCGVLDQTTCLKC